MNAGIVVWGGKDQSWTCSSMFGKWCGGDHTVLWNHWLATDDMHQLMKENKHCADSNLIQTE